MPSRVLAPSADRKNQITAYETITSVRRAGKPTAKALCPMPWRISNLVHCSSDCGPASPVSGPDPGARAQFQALAQSLASPRSDYLHWYMLYRAKALIEPEIQRMDDMSLALLNLKRLVTGVTRSQERWQFSSSVGVLHGEAPFHCALWRELQIVYCRPFKSMKADSDVSGPGSSTRTEYVFFHSAAAVLHWPSR
jgi:hypothetical protein